MIRLNTAAFYMSKIAGGTWTFLAVRNTRALVAVC